MTLDFRFFGLWVVTYLVVIPGSKGDSNIQRSIQGNKSVITVD